MSWILEVIMFPQLRRHERSSKLYVFFVKKAKVFSEPQSNRIKEYSTLSATVTISKDYFSL